MLDIALHRKLYPAISELKLQEQADDLEKQSTSPAVELIEFLKKYRDVSTSYKLSGTLFNTVNITQGGEAHYDTICPLVDCLLTYGDRYDPEESKRNLVQDIWNIKALSPEISPEDEEILKANAHHLDEDGCWIYSKETELAPGEDCNYEDAYAETWEVLNEYGGGSLLMRKIQSEVSPFM